MAENRVQMGNGSWVLGGDGVVVPPLDGVELALLDVARGGEWGAEAGGRRVAPRLCGPGGDGVAALNVVVVVVFVRENR